MKKTLIFLSLLLVTCQAVANEQNYLLGEHSSELFAKVGAPKEKMSNSLTGKSIWTYNDFKVLIRKDQVIQVKNLSNPNNGATKEIKDDNQLNISQVVNVNTKNSSDVKPEVLEEILQELETKSNASKSVASKTTPTINNNPLGQALKFQ